MLGRAGRRRRRSTSLIVAAHTTTSTSATSTSRTDDERQDDGDERHPRSDPTSQLAPPSRDVKECIPLSARGSSGAHVAAPIAWIAEAPSLEYRRLHTLMHRVLVMMIAAVLASQPAHESDWGSQDRNT
jgi:hypothetical protein